MDVKTSFAPNMNVEDNYTLQLHLLLSVYTFYYMPNDHSPAESIASGR